MMVPGELSRQSRVLTYCVAITPFMSGGFILN
jgi:hypothetical protein